MEEFKIIKEYFKNLNRKLGNISSIIYIFLYVVSILLFAIFYYLFIPNQFYHTTIQYEHSLEKYVTPLENNLEKNLLFKIKDTYPQKTIKFKDLKIDFDTLEISNLQVFSDTNSMFRFDLSLLVEDNDKGYYINSEVLSKINNSSYLDLIPKFKNNTKLDIIEERELKKILFPFDNNNLVPIAFKMKLTTKFKNDLINYINGVNGFPSNIDDNLSRMIYLSAVTITTLGYGDIVPLTKLARYSIAFEAVWGLVIMGLFLNSLAYQIKKQ